MFIVAVVVVVVVFFFQIGGNQGKKSIGTELDAIQLSIFSHRFMSTAEQMGR